MFLVLFQVQAVVSRPEPPSFVEVGPIVVMIFLVGWIVGCIMARYYYKEEVKSPDYSEEIVMNLGCNYLIRVIGTNNCLLFERTVTKFDNNFNDGTIEFLTLDGEFGSIRPGKNTLIVEEISSSSSK